MRERKMYYKVLVIDVAPIESSILDEKNFGTREEARAWARVVDPEGYRAKIIQLPREGIRVDGQTY